MNNSEYNIRFRDIEDADSKKVYQICVRKFLSFLKREDLFWKFKHNVYSFHNVSLHDYFKAMPALFIEYYQRDARILDWMFNFVELAFEFENVPEGFDFWKSVDNKWRSRCERLFSDAMKNYIDDKFALLEKRDGKI